ncbi:hypothetical protein BS17DRAFT_700379, partial [Gyrodon lividus]
AYKEYDGKVNFTTDAWTAPNHRVFIAFTVHLEHKGEPLTMPLDIVEVVRSHTGLEMATVFAKILEEFGLTDKILAMECNNAANNNVIVEELSKLAPEFAGSASHTCCFLHIVNLISKSLIHQFNMKKMSTDQDAELAELGRELAEEEATLLSKTERDDNDEVAEESDNDEGWVDEIEELMRRKEWSWREPYIQ